MAEPLLTGTAGDPAVHSFAEVLEELCASAPAVAVVDGDLWVTVTTGADLPEVGWKLHVSATTANAPDVLRAAVPVLLGHGCDFKVARTSLRLEQLNHGVLGITQAGKFLTAYPAGDPECLSVARDLDAALAGFEAPPIPFDRRVRLGSVVHYRYGAIAAGDVELPDGRSGVEVEIQGRRFTDDRRVPVPAGLADPFAAGGSVANVTEPPLLVGQRYCGLDVAHRSASGEVFRGVDLRTMLPVVIKRAWRLATLDPHGRDATARLRREYEALRAVARPAPLPAALAFEEDEQGAVLVETQLTGTTLLNVVLASRRAGVALPADAVEAWERELREALALLHDAGYVHCDVSPRNVMIAPDGALRVIDLEASHPIGSAEPAFGRGTAGFAAAAQGRPPGPGDDVVSARRVIAFARGEFRGGPDGSDECLPAEVSVEEVVDRLGADLERRHQAGEMLAPGLLAGWSGPLLVLADLAARGAPVAGLVDRLAGEVARSATADGGGPGFGSGRLGSAVALARAAVVLGDPARASAARDLAGPAVEEVLLAGHPGIGRGVGGAALGVAALVGLGVLGGGDPQVSRTVPRMRDHLVELSRARGPVDLLAGAAGDLLGALRLREVLPAEVPVEVVGAIVSRLRRTARACGPAAEGATWPQAPGRPGMGPGLFHGTAGVAAALGGAAQTIDPSAGALARAALVASAATPLCEGALDEGWAGVRVARCLVGVVTPGDPVWPDTSLARISGLSLARGLCGALVAGRSDGVALAWLGLAPVAGADGPA